MSVTSSSRSARPATVRPPPPASRRSRRELAAHLVQRHGALAVLVVVVVAFSFVVPQLRHARPTSATSRCSRPSWPIVALGMTFVIITGGIDLSVGSRLRARRRARRLGLAVRRRWSRSPLPLALCGLIGLVNGLLIARAGMAPFIVTLAVAARRPRAAAGAHRRGRDHVPRARGRRLPRARRRASVLGARPTRCGSPLALFVVFGAWCCTAPGSARRCSRSAAAGRGGADGPAGGPGQDRRSTCMSGLLAGLAGAQRGVAGLRRHHPRRRHGARRDRRRGHRRHAADRRRRLRHRHARRGAAARRHPEPDQPDRLAELLVQSVVSGAFLIVVVVLQTLLSRTQRL